MAWRASRRTTLGQFAPVNYLDPGATLPEGWRLAFRGHSHTHGAHDASIARGALDFTRYPDVTDLLIAADALLTDYSSLMFDFAVTGNDGHASRRVVDAVFGAGTHGPR